MKMLNGQAMHNLTSPKNDRKNRRARAINLNSLIYSENDLYGLFST